MCACCAPNPPLPGAGCRSVKGRPPGACLCSVWAAAAASGGGASLQGRGWWRAVQAQAPPAARELPSRWFETGMPGAARIGAGLLAHAQAIPGPGRARRREGSKVHLGRPSPGPGRRARAPAGCLPRLEMSRTALCASGRRCRALQAESPRGRRGLWVRAAHQQACPGAMAVMWRASGLQLTAPNAACDVWLPLQLAAPAAAAPACSSSSCRLMQCVGCAYEYAGRTAGEQAAGAGSLAGPPSAARPASLRACFGRLNSLG